MSNEPSLPNLKLYEVFPTGSKNYHYLEKLWEEEKCRLPKTFCGRTRKKCYPDFGCYAGKSSSLT